MGDGRVGRAERASPLARQAQRGRAARDARTDILDLQRQAGNAAVSLAFGTARTLLVTVIDLVMTHKDLIPWDISFELQSRLINALSDMNQLERILELERLRQEVEDLTRQESEMRALLDRGEDHAAGHPGKRPAERIQVLGAIALGVDDEMELTDRVFHARHPDRRDAPLDPTDPADAQLVREWTSIRRTLVRPVLQSQLGRLVREADPGPPTVDPATFVAAAPRS